MNREQTLPPFESVVSTGGFLTDAEMDGLIADHASLLSQGGLGTGNTDTEVRRSQIAFLRNEPRYTWLHTDFGKLVPCKADRTRGTLIAFPSFVVHRVTPVTRGTRWSLVAWVAGARWR